MTNAIAPAMTPAAIPRQSRCAGQGSLFITGGATEVDDVIYVNLYEVAADGASCRLHRLAFTGGGYNDLDALAVSRDGRVFFATRNAYGQFER